MKTTTMTAEQARWTIDQLWGAGKRFDVFHQRIYWRRGNYSNDAAYDPKLGSPTDPNNPYKDVTSYQSDILGRTGREIVARLGENPVICSVDAPEDTQTGAAQADDIAAIINSWTMQEQERAGYRWQDRASWGQVKDAVAILEWGIAGNWGSNGVAEDVKAGTIARRRAEEGCPFWVDFADPTACAWTYDRSRKPGPARFVKVYEVARLEYESATEDATESDESDEEQPAPGYTRTSSVSGGNADSPSQSDDWGERITVRCLWTREDYFEFVGEESTPRKAFAHGYGRIPVEIIAAEDTGDADPVYRWRPYLEGLYSQKPFVDRMMTLTGATSEMGARPFTYLRQTVAGAALPLLGEDGTPNDATDQSALQGTLPAGFEYGQIQFATPRDIKEFLAFLVEELEKSKPSTGQAQIGTGSTAWKFRLEQQQASVAPKALIMKQASAFRAMWNNWLYLLGKPAEEGGIGEDVSAYPYDGETNKLSRKKLITVPWKNLAGYTAEADIDPMSSAERTTLMQLLAEFLQQGLILKEDFYEAMGKANPAEYMLRLTAERMVEPYNEQYAQQFVAAVLGPGAMLGRDGELVGMGGAQVDPASLLAQNGWKPQQQAPAPQDQVGQGSQIAGQSIMPGMGTLAAPGTLPIAAQGQASRFMNGVTG